MATWQAYQSGPKRDRKVVIAGVVAGVLVIVAAIGITQLGGGDSNNGVTLGPTIAPTTTTDKLTGVLDRASTPSTAPTAPAIGGPGKSVVFTSEQLAARNPQSRSGLNPDEFAAASSVAAEFNLAQTTGAGAEKFPGYYDGIRYTNTPWIQPSTYQLQYAYAEKTANPALLKTQVWFNGVTSTDNSVVYQGISTVYFSVDSDGSYRPIHPEAITAAGLERPNFDLRFFGPMDAM